MTRKKVRVVYVFLIALMLVGCVSTALNPKVGDTFDNNYLSDNPTKSYIKPDKDAFFLYQGDYDGGQVYKRNKRWTISTDEVKGGILVKNGLIAKIYNEEEIESIDKKINSTNKIIASENTISHSDKKSKPLTPSQQRELSKINTQLAAGVFNMILNANANNSSPSGSRGGSYCIQVQSANSYYSVSNVRQHDIGPDYVTFVWNIKSVSRTGGSGGSSGLDRMTCGRNRPNKYRSTSSIATCYPC